MMMSADDLPLDLELRRRFLERCPDLGGTIDAALAEKFVLVKYDRDHTFYSFDDTLADRPLRSILLGQVSLVQRRGREQVARSCGPMSTFGEEGVKAWNDTSSAGTQAMVETVSAVTKSVTYVLELRASRFAEVLGAPGGDNPLLARILGAYDVHEIAPEIVKALADCSELVEVSSEGLYQLLEGAEIRRVKAGERLAPAGATSEAFFVLLERGNGFELRRSGDGESRDEVSQIAAPACVGLGQMIKDLPLDAAIHVRRDGTVLSVSAETFWGMFKFNTDFQRAIIRGNDLDVHAGKGRGPAVDRSATSVFLMVPALGLDVPLRGLTDLLAESIATHLHDSVLVIHAVPKPRPGEATSVMPVVRPPMVGRAWLEHCWVEIGDSLLGDLAAERARRAASLGGDEGRPDVTLIELSELGNLRRFLGEFNDIDFPFKVVHLTDRPDSLPPIPFIAAGASILYTGLLDATPPVLGVGAAAHRASGSGATKATIDVATSAAKNVATFARRIWSGFKEAQSVALGHLPPAWPLGTVRLRLPKGLLAALAEARGKAPARLVDLGEVLATETRPTMERWARAVTTRRVGLALGGGGTYGDVHVPFIRALVAQGVPIDMVSGSSVGSTIGAYYCGLDLAGLDLYWKHRSMILAAGTFGFISSAAVEIAMTYDLGQLQLDQTEIPFFPVVTDADVGVESYLSKGTYAFGVRASGSLPPLLGPTVQGDRRYLDGGLVANVPVNVLTAEGAALIVASNPIARLAQRPRQQPFKLPLFGVLLRESNPFARLDDAARMVPMIFGVAGQSQAANADVMYRPAATEASLTAGFGQDFEVNALASVLLKNAVAEVVKKWRASLGNQPSRVPAQSGEHEHRLEVAGTRAAIDPVRADAATLALAAKAEAMSGDLDLAGLLAIEASKLTRSPSVDEVLRLVLGRRGQMERSLAVAGSGEARCVAWSPDGDLLAVGTCDGIVRIWDARVAHAEPLGTIDHARGGTDKAILGLAFSSDGRRIIAAGLDSEASVHEVIRGPGNSFELKSIFQERVGTWDQWGVALSPSGAQALVTWGARSDLAIFDLDGASSKPRHVLKGQATCRHAAWEPGGARVAAAMDDGMAVIWSATTGAALETIVTGERGPVRVAWHPLGGALIVACEESATVHDLTAAAHARAKPVVLEGHRRQIIGLAWSDDGSRVVTVSKDLTARVWEAKTGQFRMSLRSLNGHFAGAAFRPKSARMIATWDELGSIVVWNAETGESRTTLSGHAGSINDARWSPDGERLATAGTDATARLWAPEKVGQVAYLGHVDARRPGLTVAAFSPSGSDHMVTAGVDGSAHLWRASDGVELAALASASVEGGPADARFSPDGELVAVTQARVAVPLLFTTCDLRAAVTLAAPPVSDDAPQTDPQRIRWSPDGSRLAVKQRTTVVVWSATSGAIERVIVSPHNIVSLCWNPAGDRLALSLWTSGDAVEIWDATGNALARTRLGGYQDGIWSVDWSADGRYLATACNAGVACVHDAESGARLTSRAHGAAVKVVALSPDGRWLATGDDAKAMTVWDWAVEGSIPVSGPSAHGSRIRQVTWSKDSRSLVSLSEDGLVCLWERRDAGAATSFVNVGTVRNVRGRNEVVALSPDGKWLVTGDDEGCARIHPVAHDDLVEAVRRRLGRSALTDAEWMQHLPRRRPLPVAAGPKVAAAPAKA